MKRSEPVLHSGWQRATDTYLLDEFDRRRDRRQTADRQLRRVVRAWLDKAWRGVREQREKMRQAAHTARLFGGYLGGQWKCAGHTQKRPPPGPQSSWPRYRGAMEQAQWKSRVAYAPCVSREWSPDQGGLRVSRLRGGRRRLRSLTTPYARVSRSHLATRVKRSPAQHHHREAKTRPSTSPGVTRVYVAPRHNNTHNSRHRHHGQFRQQPYRSATRPSISTTTNAAARRPFWASLRGALQADDAKLPLFRE